MSTSAKHVIDGTDKSVLDGMTSSDFGLLPMVVDRVSDQHVAQPAYDTKPMDEGPTEEEAREHHEEKRPEKHFRAAHNELQRNATVVTNERILCRWSNNCFVELGDISSMGISRHLRECHFPQPYDAKSAAVCCWGGCDGIPITQGALGKHIASVHLKSTAVCCPACGVELSRADTLIRHQAEVCRPGA